MTETGNENGTVSKFLEGLQHIREYAGSLATADRNTIIVEGPMKAQAINGIAGSLIDQFATLKQDFSPQDVDRIIGEIQARRRARVIFHGGTSVSANAAGGSEIDAAEAQALALIEIRDHLDEGVRQLGRIAYLLEKQATKNQ